ncbi:MAG: DUF309 domain-containing protein [Chloroflexaceae bacterium]|jgi:hypothetical protein|nr:DUF309 domain-containing protein [Chloroflexaceae bacterium]
MYPPAYLEGIKLFNEGHFWHAHEQWEACWLQSAEPEATFYKGIIQSAAALVKWQQGNRRGMRRNWQKSQRKLEQLPATLLGLDVRAFEHSMAQFVQQVEAEQSLPPPLIVLHSGL